MMSPGPSSSALGASWTQISRETTPLSTSSPTFAGLAPHMDLGPPRPGIEARDADLQLFAGRRQPLGRQQHAEIWVQPEQRLR